jgi:hypothetical protein
MSLSFGPPPGLGKYADLRVVPNTAFGRGSEQPTGSFPQTPPIAVQLPPASSLKGQKRNFSHMEDFIASMPEQQHYDPTFYGLTASLPMSTYTTPLSVPSRAPDKSVRHSMQDDQSSSTRIPRPSKASLSYTNRIVTFARPGSVGSRHAMASRRGLALNELCRPRHFLQQTASSNISGTDASTILYMSDFPPSWDWFGERHASCKTTNTLGPYDDNFTFRWPVLNESQGMAHPQSMHQGLRQMPPALKHRNVQNSTSDATVSDFTPDPSEAFHESQAAGENRAASFGRIRNETNSVRLTGSLAGQQNAEVSGINREKQSPQQEGIQWNNSIVEFALPDLLCQPVLDASSFDNTSYFDHDFDFDFYLHSNGGGDGNVSSYAKEPDRDPKGETVSPSFDASFIVDPSDESEWAILLQPVASYMYPSEQVPQENYDNELISHAMPALDEVGPRSPDYETPITASMTEMQSLGDCPEPTEANVKASEIHAPTNRLGQGSMQSEPKAPTTSSSMISAINDDTSTSCPSIGENQIRLVAVAGR